MTRRFNTWGIRGTVGLLALAAISVGIAAYLRIDRSVWPFLLLTVPTTCFFAWGARRSSLLFDEIGLVRREPFHTEAVPYAEVERIEGHYGGILIVAQNARLDLGPETFLSTHTWNDVLSLLKAHAPTATWDAASERLLAGHLGAIRSRLLVEWLYLAVVMFLLLVVNLRP